MRTTLFLAAIVAICGKPALGADAGVSLDRYEDAARRAGFPVRDVRIQTAVTDALPLRIVPIAVPLPPLNLQVVMPIGVDMHWRLEQFKGKTADYEVVDSDWGEAFHLKSDKTSYALYKEFPEKERFDIRSRPILHWRWKAVKLPDGGSVRKGNKNDQAVQIYVVFARWPERVNSQLLGYIWDTTTPRGTLADHPKFPALIKYTVIRSGAEGLGNWIEEARDVFEDYCNPAMFGCENNKPPKVGAVAAMINTDHTQSSAESFIGDIYFAKR